MNSSEKELTANAIHHPFPYGSMQEMQETQVRSLGQEDPLEGIPRRASQPTPGFLPGESYGQRSLVGYSP